MANELALVAQQRAALEAVRRIQFSFELTLRQAGVKGADVTATLATLESAIAAQDDKISEKYMDLHFELTN